MTVTASSSTVSRRQSWTTAGILIFPALCILGLLIGFWVGYQQGYVWESIQPQTAPIVEKVYDVADLLFLPNADRSTATPDFDSLIELITTTVDPVTWGDVGGRGMISPKPTNLTVLIRQTEEVHKRIEDLLNEVRQRPALPPQPPISADK